MSARWSDYFLPEDFTSFWRQRIQEGGSVCVIFGLGFDPRCLSTLTTLSGFAGEKQLSYVSLNLQTRSSDVQPGRELQPLVAENTRRLAKLANVTRLASGDVLLQDSSRYPIGGRSALGFLGSIVDELRAFKHVVVDINGMPRSIFYPIISFLCRRADQGLLQNLHIAVLEAAAYDSKIKHAEFGEADYIHTFRIEGSKKVVWLPVISTNERERILKIFEQIKADCLEICPILPFPGTPLRKVDDILIENSDVLYQELRVTSDNILLCDETNPFDIYRKILNLHDYYVEKLSPLVGEITTVVSPLSSKRLSLGMLLAAIDRRLPVSYVEAGLYSVDGVLDSAILDSRQFFEVWLAGEPYQGGRTSYV